MNRLVVCRQGRRVFGWSYVPGGGAPQTVELIRGDEVLGRRLANLTLANKNNFLSNAEQSRLAFEFLVRPDDLRLGGSQLSIRVVENGETRPVPVPKNPHLGTIQEFHVDFVDLNTFGGWSWDPETPDVPTNVNLIVPSTGGDRTTYSILIVANYFRADQAGNGFANGNCGFHLHWPTTLPIAARSKAILRCGAIQHDLGKKYRTLTLAAGISLPRSIVSL